MKVLACVDDDLRYDDVLAALSWCLRLGDSDEVLVTHVVAPLRWMPSKGDADPGWGGTERAIIEKAQDFLAQTAERVAHVKAKELLLEGDAATEIAKAGVEHGVDVIVLGALGQARSEDFLVGSVAEKIGAASERHVLMVRGPAPEPSEPFRALLAVDGSDASFDTVEAFTRVTRADRATIQVLHVLELPPATWDLGVEDEGQPSVSIPPSYRERADRALERASEILHAHGLDASEELRRGSAAGEVVEGAVLFHANLVVVGSRGHGVPGVVNAWSGSVARRVARHAPCSVLIAHSD